MLNRFLVSLLCRFPLYIKLDRISIKVETMLWIIEIIFSNINPCFASLSLFENKPECLLINIMIVTLSDYILNETRN